MKHPKTLNEAVSVLKSILKEEELNEIKELSEANVIQLHFGLANFIWNNIDLSSDYKL